MTIKSGLIRVSLAPEPRSPQERRKPRPLPSLHARVAASAAPTGSGGPGRVPLESSLPSAARTEMSDQKPASPESAEDFRLAALDYHRLAPAGKIKVTATKPMVTQRELALAYSPGVAYACEEIVADPAAAHDYTARGNLVAVISNGTAVLGLGDIGPLAGKPVMEGKGVLFQKFAGIDVFDIEVDERDPDRLVEIIASLEPTFGGIN